VSALDPTGRPIVILEDDRLVALTLTNVLTESGVANDIEVFYDGDAAHERLARAAAGEAPVPVLLIFDLHVPGRSGLDVLDFVRSHAPLADVPAIMVSGSDADADIEDAYELGVSAYLVKPAGIMGLRDMLGEVGLRFLLLPPEPG
jgi:CheY-like chemotaxis protein